MLVAYTTTWTSKSVATVTQLVTFYLCVALILNLPSNYHLGLFERLLLFLFSWGVCFAWCILRLYIFFGFARKIWYDPLFASIASEEYAQYAALESGLWYALCDLEHCPYSLLCIYQQHSNLISHSKHVVHWPTIPCNLPVIFLHPATSL